MTLRKTVAAFLLPTLILPALPAAGSPAQADDLQKAAAFRRELAAMIDDFEGLLAGSPDNAELVRSLADTQARLAELPTEKFAHLEPLAAKIEQLRRVTAEAKRQAAAARTLPAKSAGFPTAPYPNVNWSFLFDAATEEPDDNTDSGSGGDVCSLANSPSANTQFSLLNLSLVAEAARDTARRICDQIVEVLGIGANVAIACIATDLLYLVERGILDNQLLCSANVEAAEVSGSYSRLDHLHTDLVSTESSLTTRIATAETNLTAEVNANEALILDLDADLLAHDQNLTDRADAIDGALDAQAQFLADFRAENLRLEIETNLATPAGGSISSFHRVQALGGELEVVRDIVAESIANLIAAGESVFNAESLLAQADALLVAGQDAAAYDQLARAYRAATR